MQAFMLNRKLTSHGLISKKVVVVYGFSFFISNYVENPPQNENKLIKTEIEFCTQTFWKIRQR